MKFIIVFVALLSVVFATPVDNSAATAHVVRSDVETKLDGYNYAVETSDGKSHQEEGYLVNVGSEDESIAVRGSYSYVGDDGVTYTVHYIADQNGFQPEGAHLPVA